ncbi:MAG: hypothetical protein Q4E57_05115 [Eubacteriales bacterium]|nr:hypothetical protein [Eubacteriales bacterium]
MKKYDAVCPYCWKINRDLYLEDTNGWMECEGCKRAVQVMMPAGITGTRGIVPSIHMMEWRPAPEDDWGWAS